MISKAEGFNEDGGGFDDEFEDGVWFLGNFRLGVFNKKEDCRNFNGVRISDPDDSGDVDGEGINSDLVSVVIKECGMGMKGDESGSMAAEV